MRRVWRGGGGWWSERVAWQQVVGLYGPACSHSSLWAGWVGGCEEGGWVGGWVGVRRVWRGGGGW